MTSEKRTLKPWQVLKTQEIFAAHPWVKLSVQEVGLPDGRVIPDYYQIVLQEYVVIFAQTADHQVIMERQYKHGLKRVSLTLPGGTIEPGEDPLEAAKRELLEETGYVAETWRPLGSYVISANYGCGRAHLFTARNAQSVAQPNSGDLEEMEIISLPLEQVIAAMQQGEVVSLGAIATLALAIHPEFNPKS
jgi:ADP-ribose pyrophosphatase